MLRAPFWVMHPLLCENLTVRGVHVQNDGPNGDGCDPESCKNVLIEGCFFDTGDDCIAIKSGRNRDGRRWNIPTENVIVRHCRMENGHGGVVVDVQVGQCNEAVLKINLVYDKKEICQRDFYPVVKNVFLENVTCNKSKFGVKIEGFEDRCNINNIIVKDCTFNGVTTDSNSIIGKTEGVQFINLKLNGKVVK